MNAAQGALILERLLTDPKARGALQTLQNAATPQHVRDQIDATERDMATLARTVGSLMDGTEALHDFADAPAWLRMELSTRVTALIDGTIDTCLHNPTPDEMRPVFAAACRPNLVACARCPHLLAMPKGSAADATCDACGHVCAGPDVDDGIYPGMTRMGLLIFTYGTCRGCRPQYATSPP